jgi:hypothetical protein
MKTCPECYNVIRKSLRKCPYCGYVFPYYEFIFDAVWQIIVVILLLATALFLIINLWDFKLY